MNATIKRLAADQEGLADEVHRLRICVSMLREACSLALSWVENMRIIPGGERDKLRQALRLALGSTDPEKTEVQP